MATELAHLTPAERMGGRGAVLGPPDVQGRGFEVDLLPAHVHHFGRSEAMPVGQKHHEGVTVAVAVGLGCLDKLLDLVGGQTASDDAAQFPYAFGRRAQAALVDTV